MRHRHGNRIVHHNACETPLEGWKPLQYAAFGRRICVVTSAPAWPPGISATKPNPTPTIYPPYVHVGPRRCRFIVDAILGPTTLYPHGILILTVALLRLAAFAKACTPSLSGPLPHWLDQFRIFPLPAPRGTLSSSSLSPWHLSAIPGASAAKGSQFAAIDQEELARDLAGRVGGWVGGWVGYWWRYVGAASGILLPLIVLV